MPVLGMVEDTQNRGDLLLEYIADHEQIDPKDILDYELYLYNMDLPVSMGLHEEFISAPRLDDTTAVSAIIHGLIESTPSSESTTNSCWLVLLSSPRYSFTREIL